MSDTQTHKIITRFSAWNTTHNILWTFHCDCATSYATHAQQMIVCVRCRRRQQQQHYGIVFLRQSDVRNLWAERTHCRVFSSSSPQPKNCKARKRPKKKAIHFQHGSRINQCDLQQAPVLSAYALAFRSLAWSECLNWLCVYTSNYFFVMVFMCTQLSSGYLVCGFAVRVGFYTHGEKWKATMCCWWLCGCCCNHLHKQIVLLISGRCCGCISMPNNMRWGCAGVFGHVRCFCVVLGNLSLSLSTIFHVYSKVQ